MSHSDLSLIQIYSSTIHGLNILFTFAAMKLLRTFLVMVLLGIGYNAIAQTEEADTTGRAGFQPALMCGRLKTCPPSILPDTNDYYKPEFGIR